MRKARAAAGRVTNGATWGNGGNGNENSMSGKRRHRRHCHHCKHHKHTQKHRHMHSDLYFSQCSALRGASHVCVPALPATNKSGC